MNIDYQEDLMRAEAAHAVMQARLRGVEGPDPVTLKLLAKMGHSIQGMASHASTDAEVFEGLWNHATKHADPMLIRTMLSKPPENVMLLSAFRWVGCGLPVVTMGHKYAAALLATTVPEEVYEHVILPWRAFAIQVPDNLLFCDSNRGGLSQVRSIMVQRLDESAASKWVYIALTENVLLWRFCPDIKDLLLERLTTNVYENLSFMLDINDIDSRVSAMIGRLIVNSCLAMSDPSNLKGPSTSSRKPGCKGKRRQEREEPSMRTYVLGKTITLDCRNAVAAYCRGDRQPPSVQVLVRGHWKMQPCGAGRYQRKLIHVEPYWRGPQDAPINVKAIQLGREKT